MKSKYDTSDLSAILFFSIRKLQLDVLKSFLDVIEWNRCKDVQYPVEVSDTSVCYIGGCEAELLNFSPCALPNNYSVDTAMTTAIQIQFQKL